MRNTGICMIALLALQAPWWETCHSADRDPKLNQEIEKQEKIYHSKGEQRPSGYTVDRTLSVYTDALSPDFAGTLANLGPQDRWLDIGAGEGRAILDYYAPDYDLKYWQGRAQRGKKARSVAMSIEDRMTPVWRQNAANLEPNQIQYLSNKRLREYSVEELGRFQIITDVIGGFSYVDNLSLFIEKVLDFLELNGSFYTVLQDVHSEGGTNRPHYAGSQFLTEIANTDGSEVKVCSWLKSIACVKVTCDLKADWTPPVEAFRVQKVCAEVAVPALVPLNYQAGTPPERRYRLKN